MFPYEDSKILSVCLSGCLYPEKRNHSSFVNISLTLVIDTSMERSSLVVARTSKHKTVYCFFNIYLGPTGQNYQHELKQLQSVNTKHILCIFKLISPLLSHDFLAPQVAT